MHIPATVLMDMQAIYPTWLVPRLMTSMSKSYVEMSSDPLIAAALGYSANTEPFDWFNCFIMLEAYVQSLLPCFMSEFLNPSPFLFL